MSELPVGDELDILSGLGNGYDTSKSGEKPVLIGGGAGVPPMYMLCKKLVAEGKKEEATAALNAAISLLDKNSQKGIISVNSANRKKAHLQHAVAALA